MSNLEDNQPGSEKEEVAKQLLRGNLYVHDILSKYAGRINELQSYLQVLVDLVIEKGISNPEEINQRFLETAEKAVVEKRSINPDLFLRIDIEEEKEDQLPMVNCAERIHVCKAVCCKLEFALSVSEVEDGAVKWDLGRPYLIRQNEKGYCCHNGSGTHLCEIYENRPQCCSRYNCSGDTRIWKDFEKMELNHEWIDENTRSQSPGFKVTTDLPGS